MSCGLHRSQIIQAHIFHAGKTFNSGHFFHVGHIFHASNLFQAGHVFQMVHGYLASPNLGQVMYFMHIAYSTQVTHSALVP